uniref:TetR/AcrR family transcriptional regulator n=1 Tax=Streptomyces sp. NBC_00049 TaxID=2903617 RepID=A0AAU2JWT1_9ACTN
MPAKSPASATGSAADAGAVAPGTEAAASQPGSSRKAQAARTEKALKEAARRVFAEKGFLNAKISEISAEAGRASGSFYNHFPSKESVLEALLTDWISEARRHLTGHGDSHDLSDPEHLRWHVAVVWHMYKNHRPEIRALHEAAIVNDVFARRLAELQLAETRVLREHLQDMQDNGCSLPGKVDLVASAMMAMLNEFSRSWLLADGRPAGRAPGDDEAIDTLTAFILHGIAGPGGGKR